MAFILRIYRSKRRNYPYIFQVALPTKACVLVYIVALQCEVIDNQLLHINDFS
jgi:hypothetical protein